MNKLEQKIIKANEEYRKGVPIMSDNEYDELIDSLVKLYPCSELLKKAVIEDKPKSRKENLPIPMYSMNKVKTVQEVKAWAISNGISHDELLIATPKYDGISLCENEESKATWTRGDGIEGQRSDKHFEKMNAPVTGVDFYSFGEAIISKQNWKDHFEGKIDPYSGKPYKVARNTVAGLFNRDTAPEELKYVNYMRYGMEEDINRDKDNQLFNLNKVNKVEVPFYKMKLKDLDESILDTLYKDWGEQFQIDGIIIEVNDNVIRKRLGREVNGNPKYARAVKLAKWSESHDVTITGHKFNISKQGLLKGTVIFDPVIIDGTEVKQATFYNAAFLTDFILTKNRKIIVKKSGDVIPKIVEVEGIAIPQREDYKSGKEFEMALSEAEKRVGELVPKDEKEWLSDSLTFCPECGMPLVWNDNFVELVCTNKECKGVRLSKLQHFFSTIGMEEFGDKEVERLFKGGFLNYFDILSISKENLLKLEGWGESKANKLLKQFKQLKEEGIPLAKLLHALDLFQGKLGEKTIQMIFDNLPECIELKKLSIEDLIKVEGVSDISAKVFLNGYSRYFENYVNNMSHYIRVKYISTPKVEQIGDKFTGWKACFSGVRLKGDSLQQFEAQGGTVVSGVSKNTTHLVLKDVGSTSSKAKKARELGIEIIDLESLMNKLG